MRQQRDCSHANSAKGSLTAWDCLTLARTDLKEADARILVCDVLSVPLANLYAHPDRLVPDHLAAQLRDWIARRKAGTPLAYITGLRTFRSIELEINPAVLIPRFETEALVETALKSISRKTRVLDLGTGSGCIALAIRKETGATVDASDISNTALELCRKNARSLELDIRTVHSNWFKNLTGPFDVIVCNPPYVASNDPHFRLGDLLFEPRIALDGGTTGFAALDIVIEKSPHYLARGGWLFIEHAPEQAGHVGECFARSRFTNISTETDLEGLPRITGGSVS